MNLWIVYHETGQSFCDKELEFLYDTRSEFSVIKRVSGKSSSGELHPGKIFPREFRPKSKLGPHTFLLIGVYMSFLHDLYNF